MMTADTLGKNSAFSSRWTPATLAMTIHDLKPMNQTVLSLIQSLDDERTPTLPIEAIALDPVLLTRVLRVANSSFYGLEGKVTGLKNALSIVGAHSVVNLAVALGLNQSVPSENPFHPSHLWVERLFIAEWLKRVAPSLGIYDDEAYTLGLLFDVGKFTLYTMWPEAFVKVNEIVFQKKLPWWKAERHLLGFDYASVGVLVGEACQLPVSIIRAIAAQLTDSYVSPDSVVLNKNSTAGTVTASEKDLSKLNDNSLGALLSAAVMLYHAIRVYGVNNAIKRREVRSAFARAGLPHDVGVSQIHPSFYAAHNTILDMMGNFADNS